MQCHKVLRPPLRLHCLSPIGRLEQGKAIDKAARFFSACWIAQLAVVRLMAACIPIPTHFRRDVLCPFFQIASLTLLDLPHTLHHLASALLASPLRKCFIYPVSFATKQSPPFHPTRFHHGAYQVYRPICGYQNPHCSTCEFSLACVTSRSDFIGFPEI